MILNILLQNKKKYNNTLKEKEKNKVKEIFELCDKNLDGGVDMK